MKPSKVVFARRLNSGVVGRGGKAGFPTYRISRACFIKPAVLALVR